MTAIIAPVVIAPDGRVIDGVAVAQAMQAQGYDEKQIVTLATELISEVTTTIARDQVAANGAIAADAALAR